MMNQDDSVRYAVDLARKHSEALSFIPRPRLEWYAQHGQLWIATESDEPCGMLVIGNGWPLLKIYQACIQDDARRLAHGTRLVQRLITQATTKGYEAMSLWCATELESNQFWAALGFLPTEQRAGGTRRRRVHQRWMLGLTQPLQRRLDFGNESNHELEQPWRG